MRLKVIKDEPSLMAHRSMFLDGPSKYEERIVDVMVDGGLGDVEPSDIIGKTVSCEYVFPSKSNPDVLIAMYVMMED